MRWDRLQGWALVWVCLAAGWVPASGQAEPTGRDRRRTPVVEAYERARDSVVNISATAKIEVERWGVNLQPGDPVELEFWRERQGALYSWDARLYAR